MFELTDEDFIPDKDELDNGPYDAPSTIPYPIPNAMEELPFIRCSSCGKDISNVSLKVSDRIRELEREYYHFTGAKMDRTNFEAARKKALTEIAPIAQFPRYCCRLNILEQEILREQPTYNKRYIEGIKLPDPQSGNIPIGGKDFDEQVGNVAIEKIDKFPYNPYTLHRSDYMPNDLVETEGERLPPAIKSVELSKIDLFPPMPEIDPTFKQEIKDIHKGVSQTMFVSGIVKTGVKGYESPLVTGRTILAR